MRLIVIFLLFSLGAISAFSEEVSISIGKDAQYNCLLRLESDQYGFFSASLLQKNISGEYLEIGFDEELKSIKNRVRLLRQKINNPLFITRLQKLKFKLKLLKRNFSEIQSCQAQREQYYVDFGHGPLVDACDVASGKQNFEAKIINGKLCSGLNSPVVRLLLKNNFGNYYVCSGTVVDSRSIITAAHCVDGMINIWVETAKETFSALSFDYHSLYDGNETYDIGVVKVSRDLNVPAIPLISRLHQPIVGENIIIAGYGVTSVGGEQAEESLYAGSNTISRSSSRQLSINFNYLSQSNTCQGDSGGPLLIYRNSRWVLAGVTSNGLRQDCGYGDISNFANLINPDNFSYLKSRLPGLIP